MPSWELRPGKNKTSDGGIGGMNPIKRKGIRTKLTLAIAGLGLALLVIIFIPVSSYVLNANIREREADMKQVARWIANSYIARALTAADPAGFESFLDLSMDVAPDLAAIIIQDENKRIISARVSRDYFDYPEAASSMAAAAGIVDAAVPQGLKRIAVSIDRDQQELGSVLLCFSLSRVVERANTLRGGFVIAGLMLIIMLAITANLMARRMTRPVLTIVRAMERVSTGDLAATVDGITTGDELQTLAETFNHMTEGLREREKIKSTFSRYVSKQVFEKISQDKFLIQLGGEKKRVTVLFSDIRSFTTLSERLKPEEVVHMLNRYFDRMLEAIFKYDGTLDKFMGDAIMAVFNAPLAIEYSELKAVYAGMDMLTALKELNEEFGREGLPQIDIGIGINTGEVVAGNIGSVDRVEYTVIGDSVNLAQRLESATKEVRGRLLISETTYQAVREYVEVRDLGPIQVKGKEQPVPVYSVISVKQGA